MHAMNEALVYEHQHTLRAVADRARRGGSTERDDRVRHRALPARTTTRED